MNHGPMSYTYSPWICEASSMLGKKGKTNSFSQMGVNDGDLVIVESKLVGGFNPCEKY